MTSPFEDAKAEDANAFRGGYLNTHPTIDGDELNSWTTSNEYYSYYRRSMDTKDWGPSWPTVENEDCENKLKEEQQYCAEGRSIWLSEPKGYHLGRFRQLEKLLVDKLQSLSTDLTKLGYGNHYGSLILREIWRSPSLNGFVFADFADPSVIRPQQRSTMDVLVRVLSSAPLVCFFPLNLRKESIARALCQQLLNTPAKDDWLVSFLVDKGNVVRFAYEQITAWNLAQIAVAAVAPILVQYVGHLPSAITMNTSEPAEAAVSLKLTNPSSWEGFAIVFQGVDFYQEMHRIIQDSRRTLRFAIRKAEDETGEEWSRFVFAEQVLETIHPQLRLLVALAVNNSVVSDKQQETYKREDQLLWQTYRVVLGMNFSRTIDICKDWLCGGIKRRVLLLNSHYLVLSSDGTLQLTIQKLESTQRLVLLFLTGGYTFVHRDKKNRARAKRPSIGIYEDDGNGRSNEELETTFVESLFQKRITLRA